MSPKVAKCIILKLVYPLAKRLRSRFVWSRGRRYYIMAKLDPVKISWIIRQKQTKQLTNYTIADMMGVSPVWIKKLWSRYKKTGAVPVLARPGRRPVFATPEQKELICKAWRENDSPCAVILEKILDSKYARHIPHNRIHAVLKEMNLASDEPKKQHRKKWIRYERTYSNSLWHTDWKYLDGKGWFIAYLDDASRFVVSYGLFDSATSENAVAVLKKAIQRYGKPAAILSDRGSQFYATESEEKTKGATLFEMFLIEQGISHSLSRVRHPQTNGKIERFFRTVQDKMEWFEGDLDRLMVWYNYKRPHMSLNLDKIETPYEAYHRKMPEPGTTVIDEESGEVYDVKKE